MTRRHFYLTAALVLGALLCGLGALFPHVAAAVVAAAVHGPALGMIAGGSTVGLAVGFPVAALTPDQLSTMATPRGLEATRRPIFDTAQYVSGTTTTLSFFNTPRSDLTLSNENGSGQLAAGIWFRVWRFGFDILARATESAADDATGILDDIQALMLVGRPTFTFTLNGKALLDTVPLSFLHSSGGAQGAIGGTLTAPNIVQVGNNSFPDDGFSVDGSVIIPPVVGYGVTVTWSAAQTLKAGNTYVRFWMDGVRYRPVS